jgi:hypothetical protein
MSRLGVKASSAKKVTLVTQNISAAEWMRKSFNQEKFRKVFGYDYSISFLVGTTRSK